MKGYILLYGWLFSWILMLGGIGTMEWAYETGDDCFLKGFLLFMTWPLMSWLTQRNAKEVDEAFDRMENYLKSLINKNTD